MKCTWYLTCRKFQLCFAYNETLGCLPDFINFNKNFLFIKYENNVVLHRLSVFLISFTQTIDINKNSESIQPNVHRFHLLVPGGIIYPVVCASRTVCLSNSTVKSLLGTYLDEFTNNDMLLLTSLGRNIC
jgi:hypothetical protein